MKALICGVSGQDGGYLARLLLDKGYEVIGASRDAMANSFSNLRELGISDDIALVSMAINDFRSTLGVLKEWQPDEVYNLAGQTSVGLSFEQPVEAMESISAGTLNILEAIRFVDRPIRFYNASSAECFGDTGGFAVDEMSPFRPRSPYAVAKASAHWLVCNYRDAYGIFGCNGILFNHESVLRSKRFVTQKVVFGAAAIAGGKAVELKLGNLDVSRDWGWAPEYVEAMWRMLQQDRADDYVVATGASSSLKDFVAKAFAYFGLDWADYVQVDNRLRRPSDIAYSCGNAEKARRCLGWKAIYKLDGIIDAMCAAAEAEVCGHRHRS